MNICDFDYPDSKAFLFGRTSPAKWEIGLPKQMLRRGSWYQSVGSPLTAEISPLVHVPLKKAKVTVGLTHILDLNYFLEGFLLLSRWGHYSYRRSYMYFNWKYFYVL